MPKRSILNTNILAFHFYEMDTCTQRTQLTEMKAMEWIPPWWKRKFPKIIIKPKELIIRAKTINKLLFYPDIWCWRVTIMKTHQAFQSTPNSPEMFFLYIFSSHCKLFFLHLASSILYPIRMTPYLLLDEKQICLFVCRK